MRNSAAQARLWFILVDQNHLDELDEAVALLEPRLDGQDGKNAVLILPQPQPPLAITHSRLSSQWELDPLTATHGSVLEPGHVHILPSDRLFVMEDHVLHLRPRDMVLNTSPCDHLLPSLARHYRSGLTVVLLADPPPPEGQTLSLVRAFGGRLSTLADLRQEESVETQAVAGDEEEMPPRPPVASPPVPELSLRLAHDLRQPLQTLTLLQGLLARQVHEPKAVELVERLGDTLRQMVDLVSHPEHAASAHAIAVQPEPALPEASDAPLLTADGTPATVYVIDDDRAVREALRAVLEEEGCAVRDFDSCEAFLEDYGGEIDGCLLVDAYLPGMSGIDLLNRLYQSGPGLPAIMITGSSDVQMAVRAMKAGATDFIEKPVGATELLAGVRHALAQARDSGAEIASREKAVHCLQSLTRRQKQIMAMVLEGHPSKIIAADLGISQRTVENHRAAIMKKTGSRSLPALARLAMALQPQLSA
jgi:FixJ family two-component response regulator